MEHKSWAGNASGYQAHSSAMAGGSATRCYGVLAHGTATGRHRKRRELTAMRMAGSAASGRAPKARVDGGYDWRERKKAWVREIRVTVDQNEELGVPTDAGEYGGAP